MVWQRTKKNRTNDQIIEQVSYFNRFLERIIILMLNFGSLRRSVAQLSYLKKRLGEKN